MYRSHAFHVLSPLLVMAFGLAPWVFDDDPEPCPDQCEMEPTVWTITTSGGPHNNWLDLGVEGSAVASASEIKLDGRCWIPVEEGPLAGLCLEEYPCTPLVMIGLTIFPGPGGNGLLNYTAFGQICEATVDAEGELGVGAPAAQTTDLFLNYVGVSCGTDCNAFVGISVVGGIFGGTGSLRISGQLECSPCSSGLSVAQ